MAGEEIAVILHSVKALDGGKATVNGKIYDIEDTHYDPYLNKRFCNKCWKVHKKNRDLMKDEMKQQLKGDQRFIEEYLDKAIDIMRR